MKYNRQNLVNAEVNISRAQWMANKIDYKNPNPNDENYVVENIKTAINELQLSIGIIDKPIKKVKERMSELNMYGSPGDKFIIGLHGCRCHPYDSWDDLKKYVNQKLSEGMRFKDRCSGKEGVITKVNKTGHINVTYDPAQHPSDSSTIHKQNIILL